MHDIADEANARDGEKKCSQNVQSLTVDDENFHFGFGYANLLVSIFLG